jgi:hypothetical protein
MEAPVEEGQDPNGAVVSYLGGRSVNRTDEWVDGRTDVMRYIS